MALDTSDMSFRSTIACLLTLAVLTGGCDKQVKPREQADANQAAPATANASAPATAPKEGEKVVVDTIGTLDRHHKGEAAPAIMFQDPAGKPVSIASFAGKPVLLNLWATWCAPCVTEMPTLDVAAKTIQVVAVSQDLDGAAKVGPFFARGGFTRLKPYLDPKVGLSVAYNAVLPTSILYDSTGHEIWRMTGGMDWTTGTARELLAEAH
jgi:thiol-disulfide isomerase/thioredoxin